MAGLTVGSLFAGIGGFDLAAERAGLAVTFQAEDDRQASAVLDAHYPDVPNLGDVHGIESTPPADVLVGGFPCQDYSVAGSRGGLAGDRGALWWEYRRLISVSRPTWVIGENVPGLLTSRRGRDYETIIRSLTDIGYGVAWTILDAQYFGVAQRRRRLFFIGHSGGLPRPEVLALGEGVFGHPAPRRATRPRATPGTPVGIGGSDLSPSLTTPSRGLSAKQNQYAYVVHNDDDLSHALTGSGPAALDDQVAGGQLVSTFVVEPESGQGADLRGGRTDDLDGQGAYIVAQNTRGEIREADYAMSISTSGGKPGQGYQAVRVREGVRRLTPTECERLQGFPDGWTDVAGSSDTARYRQLGNAVAVPVAEWIFRRIAQAES
jgi:DNA (cytosine-5)-methyltransferase 1